MRAVLVFIVCAIASAAATTAGTQFQIVFLENIVEAPRDDPLEVHVSNLGNQAATVTVSTPGTTCPSQTQTVNANTVVRFEVCWWMRLVRTDYWPSYKTVLVQSSQPVMVYAVNKERYSADGHYVIPTSQLAYNYYLACYDENNLATQFAISATNVTDVHVELPSNVNIPVEVTYHGLRYTNGGKFTMRLQQYETFLAQSRGDMTGAKITSNSPIAVFSGNIRQKQDSASRDHLVTQLQPTGDWATEFYLQPVTRDTNFGDVIRVIAQKDGTVVTLRFPNAQDASSQSLRKGGFYEFTALGAVCILSNQPVEVVQMIRSQSAPNIADVSDPSMIQAVGRSQWLSAYMSPVLRYANSPANAAELPYVKNFAYIAVSNADRGGILVDESAINPTWSIVNGVASAWLTVDGSRSHRFSHNSNQPFTVVVYGASDRESYAFALGADLSRSQCQESLTAPSDGRDNDCDGRLDEEALDGIDNDGDGLIDEDLAAVSTEAFGNAYTFMFMENNVDDNPTAQSFLEIYMSPVSANTAVSYSLVCEQGTINGTIAANDVAIISQLTAQLRHIGSGLSTKAIRVTASDNVILYGLNKQTFSTDGFLAFPNDVVGTEYYSVHFYPGQDLNEFGIVAIDPVGPTSVSVTLPVIAGVTSQANFQGQTYNGGDTIRFQLSGLLQSAQIQAASTNDNLNGAHIVSDKPISVFSGNVRARVPQAGQQAISLSRDHLVHSLAPVSTWGTEFVTMPVPRTINTGDYFLMTASQPSTAVVVTVYNTDGSSSRSNFNLASAGAYVQFDVSSTSYSRVQANKPIQLVQIVKTTTDRTTDNADPSLTLYAPVDQWSRSYLFFTPRTGQADGSGGFLPFDNYVMIAIATSQRNGLTLDGNPVSATWVELIGTPYSGTVIRVTPGRHRLSHVDEAVFFEAQMYGRADRESYELALGMKLQARACAVTNAVAGDGVDNDCDSAIDEELLNGIDDDGDSLIDEDTSAGTASGYSFYVTYMENTVEYPRDFDLELYIAAVGTAPAIVSVKAPLVNFPKYDSLIQINPGTVQGYGFTSQMRNLGQGITGNTVYVSSSSEVVVYGINKELFSTDGFLVYPETSLGTDYYTVSWYPSTLQTEFAITATADGTTVTITLPANRANLNVSANGRAYTSGSFSITLQRYQTYQAQSMGDLTGTRIQSNNRVAVFSGNVRTNCVLSNSRDHLVAQMLPTASYGQTFYLVPFAQRTVGDMVRVIASQSNTAINLDGQLQTTISAGGYYEFTLASSAYRLLTTSSPVQVLQFMKSQDGRDNPEQADPAMFTVPAVSNFITTATFITPVYSGGNKPKTDYQNQLTIVIQNGQQGNLRFNGNPLTSTNWISIPNNYVTATISIPSGKANTLTTANNGNAPFYGRLYGYADRESYAFPIGFRF